MTDFRFTPQGVNELTTLIRIHQGFIDSENPESVYVLYGKQGVDAGHISHTVLVHNSHPAPTEGFQVRRKDLDDASAHLISAVPSLVPLGVIHTHEDDAVPWPSATDIADARPDYLHMILCPRHRTYVVYDGKGYIDSYRLRGDDLVNRHRESISTKMFHTNTPEGQTP